jgi:hypothetical protein
MSGRFGRMEVRRKPGWNASLCLRRASAVQGPRVQSPKSKVGLGTLGHPPTPFPPSGVVPSCQANVCRGLVNFESCQSRAKVVPGRAKVMEAIVGH